MLKNKTKIIGLTLLIIILFFSLRRNSNLTIIETNIKDLLASTISFQKKQSRDQTKSYLLQKNINQSLNEEIKELKDLLNLNSTQTEFNYENATVISRNNISWLNTLTIDKGTQHGITKDMAVITTNGLIGKISKTTKNTSEVKLLTASDITNKISIMIKVGNEEHYAILGGYDHNTNLLEISAVDKNINVEKNTIVTTSGLGKMPQGIYIGEVVKTKLDKFELSQTLYVKTKQNFNSINYVSILKENN